MGGDSRTTAHQAAERSCPDVLVFSCSAVLFLHATFAAGVEWATFNLDGVRLIDGDLALGDTPIAQASDDVYHHVNSITQERHQAANWLIGWNPLYSEVDTST